MCSRRCVRVILLFILHVSFWIFYVFFFSPSLRCCIAATMHDGTPQHYCYAYMCIIAKFNYWQNFSDNLRVAYTFSDVVW